MSNRLVGFVIVVVVTGHYRYRYYYNYFSTCNPFFTSSSSSSSIEVCGLLLPSEAQNSYFAIRAFNVELASVKDGHSSSSRMRQQQQQQEGRGGFEVLGGMTTTIALQIRMQWWREALHEIYSVNNDGDHHDDSNNNTMSKKSDNNAESAARLLSAAASLLSSSISCWKSPIVRALCEANREKKLTKRFLERLIDAREMDINTKQLATLKDASLYAEETVSSLLYLTLECTNVSTVTACRYKTHSSVRCITSYPSSYNQILFLAQLKQKGPRGCR
jgi:NADH dehydrogenase [ubiquinone] 1 alpha subcomplex assembly factor 6